MNLRLLHTTDWEQLVKQADFEPGGIADLCGISLRQLERLFAENFHKTPNEWVKEFRFRVAKELIHRGYSTKAVAAELKFASESHFCHEFKKVYGVSPQSFAPTYAGNGRMSPLSNNVVFKQSIAVE